METLMKLPMTFHFVLRIICCCLLVQLCRNGAFGMCDSVRDGMCAPTLTSISSRSCKLEWDVPSENGGYRKLDGYLYERFCLESGQLKRVQLSTKATKYEDTGLIPGKTYQFRISALIKKGYSRPGSYSHIVEAIEPPSPPLNPCISNVKNDSCLLSWTNPVTDGGTPITHFKIEMSIDDQESWMTTAGVRAQDKSVTVQELEAGKGYTFRIKAVNKLGSGNPCIMSQQPITPILIRAPCVERKGPKLLNISWDSPVIEGSSPVIRYYIQQFRTDTNIGWIQLNNTTIHPEERCNIITGLTLGKRYKFRMVVVKSEAEYIGLDTDEIEVIDSPDEPSQPEVCDVTESSCFIEWAPPVSDGGSTIEYYIVDVKENNNNWETFRKETLTMSGIDNLKKDCNYCFRVSAVNKAGTGPASEESVVIRAAGLNLKNQTSLTLVPDIEIQSKTNAAVSQSFERAIKYFLDLIEILRPLTSAVTYAQLEEVSYPLKHSAKMILFHLQATNEKFSIANAELKKRMMTMVKNQGELEQLEAQQERQCISLNENLDSLNKQLTFIRKEKKLAKKELERVAEILETTEKELSSKETTRNVTKVIGYAGLFIPIFGWAVSAIALPVAYTALEENVQTAKSNIENAKKDSISLEKKLQTKQSKITDFNRELSDIKKERANLRSRIDEIRKKCESLKTQYELQTNINEKFQKGSRFVTGATGKAEILMDQVKYLYDIRALIGPLQDLANHFSKTEACKTGLLQEENQIETNISTAINKLQMLAASEHRWSTSDLPEHQKAIRYVPVINSEETSLQALTAIDELTRNVTGPTKIMEDNKLMMVHYSDCTHSLVSAPTTIQLLGQLLLVSRKRDFSLAKVQPTNGFKFLQEPESFRASILQLAIDGDEAFSFAETSMSELRGYADTLPQHLYAALHILESGSANEICFVLNQPLDLIHEASRKCQQIAKRSEKKFNDVMSNVHELQEACVANQSHLDDEKEKLKFDMEAEDSALARAKVVQEQYDTELEKQYEYISNACTKLEKAIASSPGECEMIALGVFSNLDKALQIAGKPFRAAKQMLFQSLSITNSNATNNSVETNDKNVSQPKEKQKQRVDKKTKASCRKSKSLKSGVEKLLQILDNNTYPPTIIKDIKSKDNQNKIKSAKSEFELSKQRLEKLDSCERNDEAIELCNCGIEVADELFRENSTAMVDKIQRVYADTIEFVNDSEELLNSNIPKTPFKIKGSFLAKGAEKDALKFEMDKSKQKVKSAIEYLRFEQAEYDRLSEEAIEERREMSDMLRNLAHKKAEDINISEVLKILYECLKLFGKIKEYWHQLVDFFQSLSNIITATLSKSLKKFYDLGAGRVKSNDLGKLESLTREALRKSVLKGLEIACIVSLVAERYTEISQRFFMPMMDKLPKLLVNSSESKSDIESTFSEFEDECHSIQDQINDYLKRKALVDRTKVQERISILYATLPEIKKVAKQQKERPEISDIV